MAKKMKKICFLIIAASAMALPSLAFAQNTDCTAIGQRVAAEQAGQLTKSTPTVQNGRNVCVVVVIVPGKGEEKPRRVEIAVPAN